MDKLGRKGAKKTTEEKWGEQKACTLFVRLVESKPIFSAL
jgi:hypothetical protein